jgi:TRAP-type transport system periplasmic protein
MEGKGMKKIYPALIFICSLVLLAFFISTPASAKEDESVTLDVATFQPPGQSSMTAMNEYFKGLETATGGKVKTRFHYSGAMGKPTDHYELALKGMADIAHICIPYTPGTFPSFDIFGLPIRVPGTNPANLMTDCILELKKLGYFDKDFANVKLLAFESITPFQIQMAKDPIRTVESLKGKKLRVMGLYFPKLFQGMGVTTVFTPVSEVYIALQKGVAEGIVVPWPAQLDFKLYEVTKFVTEVNMSYAPYATLMNKAKWEKLPAAAKKYLDENSEKFSKRSADLWEQCDRDAVAQFQKTGGNVVKLESSEWEKMAKISAPLWEDWIKASDKVKFPAKKQAKDLWDLLEKRGVKDPFVGYRP